MRIALFGATGLLGNRFRELLSGQHDLIPAAGHPHDGSGVEAIDIRERSSVFQFLRTERVEVCVNSAGFVDVEGCEEAPELASAINATGARNVADACKEANIFLVHFSTDYVFPSRMTGCFDEKSVPRSLQVYGKTKLEGERAAATWSHSLIVRLPLLYGIPGPGRYSWGSSIIESISSGRSVSVDDVLIRQPLLVDDAVATVSAALRRNVRGLLHVAPSELMTQCKWARMVAERLGGSTDLVIPSSATPTVTRPTRSPLCTTRLKELDLPRPREPHQGIPDLISQLSKTMEMSPKPCSGTSNANADGIGLRGTLP
jgi:dTDP-4-dehydrorhamnose reductase